MSLFQNMLKKVQNFILGCETTLPSHLGRKIQSPKKFSVGAIYVTNVATKLGMSFTTCSFFDSKHCKKHQKGLYMLTLWYSSTHKANQVRIQDLLPKLIKSQMVLLTVQ